jgi:hypothetical protein
MRPVLYWIAGPWPGRLAIAGRPRGGDWLGEELRGLREAGVDVLVSMLEPAEETDLGLEKEKTAALATGL